MRLPQFRVRTLMLAVGVVAVLIWCAIMGMKSFIYYRLASEYGTNERQWRELAARDRQIPTRTRSVAAVWGSQIADFYAPLAKKYREAMWRPWVPVAPDPPAPVFGTETK